MPLYSNEIALNKDFIEGVKDAINNNNWNQFVEHFGTHFASSVTFGGRYFVEHTYSEQSMALFQSMKLDIHIAASIQYFNIIGMALNAEQKRYLNQTNVINSKVSTTRIASIGGEPPKSGDWMDWANTVKSNLAPVTYELTTLSVLFNFIQGINATAAIKSFQDFCNTLCDDTRCPPLTPDKPKPKPLIVSFTKSFELSGVSKSEKAYNTSDGNITVGMRINKIMIGIGSQMDSIQFFLTDGLSELALPVVGNKNFNKVYETPKYDEIKCIRFGINHSGSYWKFASIQFVTKRAVQSEIYKGSQTVN